MTTVDRHPTRKVSSRQNTLVKVLRRAFQHGELVDGLCAIEGVRLIEEAIRSGLRFRALFYGDSSEQRVQKLIPQISSHTELLALPDEVFASAVATETPQGVAALVRWPVFSLDEILEETSSPLLIGAMGIQDPGNLGTIIRSGEAFSATAIVLGAKTVSQFNPKVIRASMGSCFRLPTIKLSAAEVQSLKRRGLRIAATSSHKGKPIDGSDLTGGLVIMVGSEGAGVSQEYMVLADEFIRVPHDEKVESLNAAVATSVILYEAQRQRNPR